MMLWLLLLLCGVSWAVDTGTPAGLMADCPGMTKNTTFSDKTIRSLYVLLLQPANNIFGMVERKCKLSRGGALYAAKHLDMRNVTVHVMISGYLDSSYSPLVRGLANVYLDQGKHVIVMEIFPILVRTYPLAARTTKPLGRLLGEFLATLTEQGLSPNQLELTGGSLGSYIAAYAARRYTEITGQKPTRLTALDPAGPCYRNLPIEDRLHPGVADRVDVLHTNIDGFGIAQPLGHIDFYANGGEYQPAMISSFILPCFQLCSHVRAAAYWGISFRHPDKFLAVKCDSVADARVGNCYHGNVTTNVLGPNTDFNNKGIFYLPTGPSIPYYLGEKGLKKRKYDSNNYLIKTAPDENVVI